LSNEHEEGGTGPCIVILTNCWGSTNKFGVKKGNDWCRALSANEIYLLYRDAYPTNRSGFSMGHYGYYSGNMIAEAGSYSNGTAANLSIRCDSPKDIRSWTVEANGVNSISAEYHNTYSTFAITNIPLGATCTWAKVTLDGQAAVSDDGQGNSQWGMHQPATNQELHFKVEAASQMAAGVFPVCPITNTTYSYDAAGQMTGKSGTGVSPVSYSYDAARNLKSCAYGSGRTNFYYYDHARRLVKEEHTCTGVVEESSTFEYEGMDLIARLDNLTGDLVYFSRGLGIAPGVGDVLAESHLSSNGSLKYTLVYVQNHRGDTIALVSNSTVVARYEYGAWGNVLSHTGPVAWLTFSGKHYDSDAGLYYYGYRWYDPQAKRWTQPDPSGLAEGLDLYQFCGNDPINGVDEDGLRWRKVGPTPASGNTPAGVRMIYERESMNDTIEQLAEIAGLDPNEYNKWARTETTSKGNPWRVSVPNVWIDADLLQGWSRRSGYWAWTHCPPLLWLVNKTINLGGTVGSFVGTDLLTDSDHYIVTVHTPDDYL